MDQLIYQFKYLYTFIYLYTCCPLSGWGWDGVIDGLIIIKVIFARYLNFHHGKSPNISILPTRWLKANLRSIFELLVLTLITKHNEYPIIFP